MNDIEANIRVLDAAYKPFPTFEEWASRTSVDTARWNRYKAELQNRPAESADALKRAYEIVKRAAALDTGAIEGLYEVDRGFTFTVALETTAWELRLAEKGDDVRPLFEAQLRAYDYVLDFATKAEPISEAAIRKLHEVVCSAQATYRVMTAVGPQEQELVRGRYKVLPNHVRTRDGADHSYAPVDVTPPEMARLVAEMRGDSFLAAHPILQASYAHYGLVVIHPFADGNGRVARALASAFTYRAISMPIMILSEHKARYLDALESADGSNYQSFVDFMLARSLDTIKLVNESSLGAHVPNLEEGMAAIDSLYVTRGGYTQDQVDAAGNDLLGLVTKELSAKIPQKAGSKVHGQVSLITNHNRTPTPKYRLPIGGEKGFHITFNSDPPARAHVFKQIVLWLPKDAGGDDDIQLMLAVTGNDQLSMQASGDPAFSARMDELIPSISGVLQIRAGLFVDRLIGELLEGLKARAAKAMRGQG